MSKFTKAIAAIMLMVAVICTACTKDPENGGNDNGGNGGGNGSGSNPTTEGIYLGIIGFNYNLYPKEISLLNTSTKSSFTSFIDNLRMENLTGLYYADYNALKELKSFGEPPKLTNVALVTFTDGLDNASLDDSERNPENYPTRDAYLNALNNKIRTDKVHGLDINAYTIGLRGNDVQDVAAFQNNLKKLASNDNNMYEVTSMDEALQRFEEIAESLHSTNTTTSLSLLVPPGYDDGLVLRFTFDQVNSASNSSLFIECTYKRTTDGRRLENITYRGFKQGATSLTSVEKLSNGFYKFVFQNLKKDNDSFITEIDKNRLKLYRKVSSGWEPETEFDNNNQSSVIEEQSSALIMLVLDCTTSLGSQFSSLKTAAKRFVETLVSSNGGGGNGGGVDTQSYTITTSANPTNGGTVTGGGTYNEGASITLRAIANTNYTFDRWQDGNTTNPRTITVTSNATYTAYFTYSGGGSGNGNANGHAYVDLGLPSGTLWATCNVGATTPEGYGNYYAWGETTTKSTYNWSTYRYCNGSESTITKYCNNSNYGNNGFTDYLTTLQLSDDAARANWGGDWRMPTKAEWEELMNNTTETWTTQNGVYGRRFTASNGNSLFLPAAGCRHDGSLSGAGSYGNYWSNSLDTGSPYYAWYLYFNSGDSHMTSYYRYYGRSVRAVLPASKN